MRMLLSRSLGKVVVEPEIPVALENQARGGPAAALHRLEPAQPDEDARWFVAIAGRKGLELVAAGLFPGYEILHGAGRIARMLELHDHVSADPISRQALGHASDDAIDRLHLADTRLLRETGVDRQQHRGRGKKEAAHDAIILR